MKTCYNSNGLRTLSVEEAVRAVARAGYAGIELSLHSSHIHPFTFTRRRAKALAELIADAGIEACCLATGADDLLGTERFEPSLIHPDARGRQRRVTLIKRAIEIATWLGVHTLNFASGARKPEVSGQAARDLLAEGIRDCLDFAAGTVVLAIEPEPGFFVQTNDEAVSIIRHVNSGHFALNQDVGHARVTEDDYLGSIERTLPWTAHVHLEDIKGRRHVHEIPGDGDIDFTELFSTLRRGGYSRYLSVELYNHGATYQTALERSRDFLEAHLRKGGPVRRSRGS